ncbi:MAG: molybdenum cofactor guanylyltransferase [Erythrobacter sp.]
MLGVVLAGGQSTRYGSDKSMARFDGQSLLDRAIERLGAWCDHVVVAGHDHAEAPVLTDWPKARMGPLAGIAAALHYADHRGGSLVLSCGVDSIDLPDDLPRLLSPAPAYLESQPVIGLWPVTAAATLERILTHGTRHSVKAFAEAIAARPVRTERDPANINTPDDLAELEKRHGL